MKTIKPTEGEWKWVGNKLRNDRNKIVFTEPNLSHQTQEADDNRTLIADAGTTFNKCKLLPSQLLEQRDELLTELKAALTYVKGDGSHKDRKSIESLIKKLQP